MDWHDHEVLRRAVEALGGAQAALGDALDALDASQALAGEESPPEFILRVQEAQKAVFAALDAAIPRLEALESELLAEGQHG